MVRPLDDLLSPEALGLVSISLLAAGLVVALRLRRRQGPTPEEIEAKRREWLSFYGKLGGGEILEVSGNSISYLYAVRGITYSTSQDVSALAPYLPEDRWSIVGGVGVRYDPQNPANSIVLSERWTGLRQRSRNIG